MEADGETGEEPRGARSFTMDALQARQDPAALVGRRIEVEGKGEGLVTGLAAKGLGKATQHLVAFDIDNKGGRRVGAVPVLLMKKAGGRGAKFYLADDDDDDDWTNDGGGPAATAAASSAPEPVVYGVIVAEADSKAAKALAKAAAKTRAKERAAEEKAAAKAEKEASRAKVRVPCC